MFIVEGFLVYEYMEINTNFLGLIGVIFSFIFFYEVNKDINIKNLFVFLSFLVASTSIIPFNINNSLDKIKKEKKFENVMDNSYSLM